jgi:hypothetical protein
MFAWIDRDFKILSLGFDSDQSRRARRKYGRAPLNFSPLKIFAKLKNG